MSRHRMHTIGATLTLEEYRRLTALCRYRRAHHQPHGIAEIIREAVDRLYATDVADHDDASHAEHSG